MNQEKENRPAKDNLGTESPKPRELSTRAHLKTLATTGWTSYLVVTIGLLVLLFLTDFVAGLSVTSKAENLTKDFVLTDAPVACKTITDSEKLDFINRQKTEVVKYANAHRKTAIEFYGYFYSTFAVFSLFGLLALICGVVIAKKGYDFANPHLITVFLVSTGIVLLYQGFFGVFQQKANVDNNAKLFAAYSNLLTKIDTYCATGKIPVVDPSTVFNIAVVQPRATPTPNPSPVVTPTPNPGQAATTTRASKPSSFYVPLEADEFINYVGWQMEQLRAISIVFDDSKIVAINNDKLLVLPD